MALNTDINMPPVGPPLYRIYQEWCMGDSLQYININFDYIDQTLINLSTNITNLSAQVASCCGNLQSVPGPGPGPGPAAPRVTGLVEQTLGGGNSSSNMFIISDGSMRVIGRSSNGELGIGKVPAAAVNEVTRMPLFNPALEVGETITSVIPQGNCTFVITSLGRLYGAGENGHYQLGLGDTVDRYVFTRIFLTVGEVDVPSTPKPPSLFVKKIAAGSGGAGSSSTAGSAYLAVFALTTDGSVYVWGNNSNRQTATTSAAAALTKPTLSTLINNVKDVVSGGNNKLQTTFFLKNDNTLWVTGENTTGGAGIGSLYAGSGQALNTDIKNKVWQVLAGAGSVIANNVKRVYCGGDSGKITSWVINDTGSVFGAGFNHVRQATGAIGANVSTFTAIAAFASVDVELISAHADTQATTVYALVNTSTPGEYTLYGWGSNNFGCIGVGNVANVLAPIPVPGPWVVTGASVKQVCVAGDNTKKTALVLDSNNVLWTCGFGATGLMGNGLDNGINHTFQRVQLSLNYGKPVLIRSTNTSITGDISNFLVLMDTGRVIGWGFDASGQLAANSPAGIILVPSYVQIAV